MSDSPSNALPRFRFPEFDDAWRPSTLREVIDFLAGYAFKSSAMESKPSRYQLIKMSNVYKNEIRLDRNPSFWSELDPKLRKFVLEKNDVVLTLTGTVNKRDYGYSVAIPSNDQFLLNQRLARLRAIEKRSLDEFIRQIILTNRFFHYFFFSSKGGTGNQSNVGIEDLKDIELYFPTLPEQRKIADFLTAVDGRIGQLIQKKALLTDYKKGVMQQLFTQAIRFKDDHGNDFPDWEEKKLEEIASFHRGSALAKADLDESGEFECIHYGELFTRYNEVIREVTSRTNIVGGAKSHAGDILMPSSDVTPDGLAKASSLTTSGVILGGDINVIRPVKDIDSEFLSHLINYQKNAIIRLVTGTTVKHLYNRDMATLILDLPSSLPEQTKIADFLSAINRKIESVATQITETQTFKRGLLQQMFV
jgi:type I restriction enzyme S subunit